MTSVMSTTRIPPSAVFASHFAYGVCSKRDWTCSRVGARLKTNGLLFRVYRSFTCLNAVTTIQYTGNAAQMMNSDSSSQDAITLPIFPRRQAVECPAACHDALEERVRREHVGRVDRIAAGEQPDDGHVGEREHEREEQGDVQDRGDDRDHDLPPAREESRAVEAGRLDDLLRHGVDAGGEDGGGERQGAPPVPEDARRHRGRLLTT